MTNDERQGNRFAQGVFGVFLIVVGAALLLDRIGVANLGAYWHYWPVVLIVIGLGNLLAPGGQPGDRHGFWFLFSGLIFLVHNLDYLHLDESWPLFLVAAGAMVAWRGLRTAQPVDTQEGHHDS